MEGHRYFISSISVSDRHCDFRKTSFERVSNDTYDQFVALPVKKLYLGDVLGRHSDVTVKLEDDGEWSLKEITDDDLKKAIDLLWGYLNSQHDIDNSIMHYEE